MNDEMKAALEFAQTMLRSRGEFDPMVVAIKDSHRGHPDHLMMAPRQMRDAAEKEVTFSVMAMAARIWGAQRLVFVCDSWVVRVPPGQTYDPETEPMPSEHPNRIEAIVVSYFSLDEPDDLMTLPYVRGGDHIAFGELEPVPGDGEQGEGGGIVPTIMHKALQMTDDDVAQMLATLPANPDGESVTDANSLFAMMRSNGYAVLQA